MSDKRPSPIAGTWYPRNPDVLRQSIDQYLSSAEITPMDGEVIGIVVPHAGHRYSGGVAAHAFQCLVGLEPELVAVISPLHTPESGDIFSTAHESYVTPLGEIPVDHEMLDKMKEALPGEIEFRKIRRDSEHSLEIELPFLQRVLTKPFRLIPLMILHQSQFVAEIIGHFLGDLLKGKSALLVASSDLSHFYDASVARKLDESVLARLEAFDASGVINVERDGVGYACGRGAIATVLWAAQDLGANQVKVLKYAHSGDVTGDTHSVVGYGSAVIFKSHQQ